MSRRRGQRKGHLYKKSGSWMLRFREDQINEAGEIVRMKRAVVVAPADGPEAVSRREAQRLAWHDHLERLDRRSRKPSSMVRLADFVELKFRPYHVERRKPSGRKHYDYLLDKHVLPSLGARRLCDITVDDIEALIAAKREQGLSRQTLLHIRNCVSAIFRCAKKLRLYGDENPASAVDLGEIEGVRRRPGYTWDQARRVIAALKSPYREMALLSLATSMNVAEMCGVRLKWCNFTGEVKTVEGEVLAPHSIAVRENYYERQYGTLKTGKRRRNVPLTPDLAHRLADLVSRSRFQALDDPLFSSRNGTPIDSNNASNRHLRPLGVKLGFPVTWHAFRRAHSTFAGQVGVPLDVRMRTMGHADAAMTLSYSIEEMDRSRELPALIMGMLLGNAEGAVQ